MKSVAFGSKCVSRACSRLVLLLGCNYLQSYYLQSYTELLLLLEPDNVRLLRVRTGHCVQCWNMSRLVKYVVVDFKAL